MSRYNVFFFDADDTLFDFQKTARVSFESALRMLGCEDDSDPIFKTFKLVSLKYWKQFEKGKISKEDIRPLRFIDTFKKHKLEADPEEASSLFMSQISENVYLNEGAEDVCKAIKAKGCQVGILTNGVAMVQRRRIDKTNIGTIVDFIVLSEECEAPKPHPAMFERGLQLAGRGVGDEDKEGVIMIGDSLGSDIKGASDFGIHTCWFNPAKASKGWAKPTYQIQHLEEVLQFLEDEEE